MVCMWQSSWIMTDQGAARDARCRIVSTASMGLLRGLHEARIAPVYFALERALASCRYGMWDSKLWPARDWRQRQQLLLHSLVVWHEWR